VSRDGENHLTLLVGQIKSGEAGATLAIQNRGPEFLIQQRLGDNGIEMKLRHKNFLWFLPTTDAAPTPQITCPSDMGLHTSGG
jgi:hypothetical protein